MTEQKKEKNKWLSVLKKAAVPVVAAVGIAAVDVGLLKGSLGAQVKAVLENVQLVV